MLLFGQVPLKSTHLITAVPKPSLVYLVTEARHEQINVLGTFPEEIKGGIAMIFAQKRIQYYYLLLLFTTFRITAVFKFHGLQCHPSKCISIGAEQYPTLFTK